MLSQFYIPCDDCDMPIITLEWAGFHTNNMVLAENGWVVKCLYNKFTKKYVVRFYNPTLFMTFALKLDSLQDLAVKRHFEVKFISIGGRRNRRPMRAECFYEFTKEDVPLLLETVVELQKPVRKQQLIAAELPEAEIYQLLKRKI